jgi:colicin import membrane protein
MNAQSPTAYGLSALVHAAVALLVLFFAYAARSVVKDSPKVFELVAGEGDNYAATVAPALGGVGGIKVPAMPRDVVQPAPAEPSPPVAPPIQSAPETAPTPAKPRKAPDLLAQLKRTEMRRELNLERKYQKAQEAAAKRLAEQQKEAKVSHIDAEGIRNGVIGGSTENKEGGAGGKALTREEMSELDAYFALLKARIKENHAPPEGVSDSLSTRVEFMISANGDISQVRIVRSSGNAEFDRSVVEACETTRSIGPRPDGRSDVNVMTFKMREDETE